MTQSHSTEPKHGWLRATGDFLKKPVAVVATMGTLALGACAQEVKAAPEPGTQPTIGASETPTQPTVESAPTQSPEDREKYFADKYSIEAGLSDIELGEAFIRVTTDIYNEGATPEFVKELFAQADIPAMGDYALQVAAENMDAIKNSGLFSDEALKDNRTMMKLENWQEINGTTLYFYGITNGEVVGGGDPEDTKPYSRWNELTGAYMQSEGKKIIIKFEFDHTDNSDLNRVGEIGDGQKEISGRGVYEVTFHEEDGKMIVDRIV